LLSAVLLHGEYEHTGMLPYTNELRQKMNVFLQITGTRKKIFLSMMTTYGVTDNACQKELVSNVLTLDALF